MDCNNGLSSKKNLQLMLDTNEKSEVVVSLVKASEFSGNDVQNQVNRKNKKQSSLDLQSRIVILDTLKYMYINNEIMTFDNFVENVQRDGKVITSIQNFNLVQLTNCTEILKEIMTLNFTLVKTNSEELIIEDPDTRFERYNYLNKIIKLRNPLMKKIVYIDERIVNKHQTFQKPSVDNIISDTVLFHAVSKNGLINAIFINEATPADFVKWVKDILLDHLQPSCIVIMDNHPLHCLVEKLPISKNDNKITMLTWLIQNNIPCNKNMARPELYELIEKFQTKEVVYKVDAILKANGHEVLRLPKHFEDLCLTTPLWENIIRSGGIGISESLLHTQNQILKLLNTISPNIYNAYEGAVENKEKVIFNIDKTIEAFCENLNNIE